MIFFDFCSLKTLVHECSLSREHIPNHHSYTKTPNISNRDSRHQVRPNDRPPKSTVLSNFMMLFNLIICHTTNKTGRRAKTDENDLKRQKNIVRYEAVRLFQTVAIPIFVPFIQIGTVRSIHSGVANAACLCIKKSSGPQKT